MPSNEVTAVKPEETCIMPSNELTEKGIGHQNGN